MSFRYILAAFLIVGVTTVSLAQNTITLDEDFEDQDLTQNPEWFGDLDDFTFIQENGNTLLQLDAESDPSRTQIRTPSATAYGSWEFFIEVPATSNLNRVYTYLIADDEDLNRLDGSTVNGYAIHTGGGTFDLVRLDGGDDTVILSSDTEIESGQGYQVRVTRNENDEWQIYVGEGYGTTPELDSGTEVDDTYTESDYFGLFLRYSSAQTDSYFFDDIRITSSEDFQIHQAENSGPQTVDVAFNFPVDEATVQGQHFDISTYGTPGNATLEDDNTVRLDIGEQWDDGHYTITVNDVESADGLSLEPDSEIDFEVENPFQFSDVQVITDQLLELHFTEPVDDQEVDASDFALNGIGPPNDISFDQNNEVITLEYEPLDLGTYTLTIEDIPAESGWRLTQPQEHEIEVANPFEVEEVEVRSREELAVTFSEAVDTDALNTGDFTVDGVGNPDQISFEQGDEVVVLEYPQLDSGLHALIIDAILSDTGWTLPQPAEYGFTVVDEFEPGDVVINEFMYRNPPAGMSRYVELYNPGERYIDLAGWELMRRDGAPSQGGVFTEDSFVIGPDEYVVVTEDSTILYDTFGSRNYIEMSGYPGFTVTVEDEVRLRTADGVMADSLRYNPSVWGGNGIALERLSAEAIATSPDNWAESPAAEGGTPGAPNAAELDDTPPELVELTTPNPDTLIAEFSKNVTEPTATDPANYQLSGEGNPQIDEITLLEVPSEVRIIIDRHLESGHTYTLGVSDIEDIFGHAAEFHEYELEAVSPFQVETVEVVADDELHVSFTEEVVEGDIQENYFEVDEAGNPQTVQAGDANDELILNFEEPFPAGRHNLIIGQITSITGWQLPQPAEYLFAIVDDFTPGDVVINEFMYRSPPDGMSRYVELYNPGNSYIELAEWELMRRDGAPSQGGVFTDDSYVIGPDEYVVVTEDSTILYDTFGSRNYIEMSGYPGFTIASADEIRLRTPDGMMADSLRYDPSVWGGDGVALERISPEAISTSPDNWAESPAPEGGTPGAPNEVPPDETPPELTDLQVVHADTLIAEFSKTVTEPTATDPANYQLSGEGEPEVNELRLKEDPRQVELITNQELQHEQTYTLTVSDIADIFGNTALAHDEQVTVISPFVAERVDIRSRQELAVEFSEAVNPSELQIADFELDGSGSPNQVSYEQEDEVVVLTYDPLEAGEYTLTINPIRSVTGWSLPQPREFDVELINTFAVDQVEVTGPAELQVVFSEAVEETDIVAGHFEIDGIGSPAEVEGLQDNEVLELSFDEELASGFYELTIAEIHSASNWPLPQPADYEIVIVDDFTPGDVVINEFMYRSPPDGMSRYVELHNPGENYIDLRDWRLMRRPGAPSLGGVFTEEQFVLGPGEYAVITPDSTTLYETFGSRNYIEMSAYPGFTTTVEDEIRLVNAAEEMADSLRYSPSVWGGNGVALERISPEAISTSPDNWGESPAPEGGTPGAPNEVPPDETPPELTDLQVVHADTLIAEFSKTVTEPTATDPANYQLSGEGDPQIDEVTLREDPSETLLVIDRDLESGHTYTFGISDVEDIFGNAAEFHEIELEFVNPFQVADVQVRNRQELEVTFTEAVAAGELDTDDFTLEGAGNPEQLSFEQDDELVVLQFPPLDTGEYVLTIDAIRSVTDWPLPQPSAHEIILINTFAVDSVEVVTDDQLRVKFTEEVIEDDIEVNFFEVDRVGNPESVFAGDANDEVMLSFDEPLQSGRYKLFIDELASITGWQLPQPAEYLFAIVDEFMPGDVVINEFMYRNPPESMSRYVELYNPGNSYIELAEWELMRRDGAPSQGGVFTDDSYVIGPDEYVVVTEDSTILYDTFGSRNYIEMSGYPGFTIASADEIRLRTPDGMMADSLRYDPSVWGGSGVALERISPTAPATSPDNWGESPAPEGGTPGVPNEVELDDIPPEFTALSAPHADTLIAKFSKSLDESSATDPSNYTLTGEGDPEVDKLKLAENARHVYIIPDQDLESSGTYTVTASGIEDIFGNLSEEQSRSVTWYFIEPADSADVFVNEFMYDAPDHYSRYIELHNRSEKAVDIAGWTYNNNTGNRRTISSERVVIPPDSFLVFGPDPSLLEIFPDMHYVEMSSFPALKTGGDDLVIRDDEGMLIDSLSYTPDWGGDEVALERRSTGVAAWYSDNWGDSPSELLGSAGRPNQIEQDEDPPVFTGLNIPQADTLIASFDKSLNESSATDASNYSLMGGGSPEIEELKLADNATEVYIIPDRDLESGGTYTVTASGIEDIFGNVSDEQTHSATWYITEPADSADVFVTEFMYDAPDNYSRYIELYNRSDKAIDIAGWTYNNDTGTRRTITTQQTVIPPDSLLVFGPDPSLLDIFPDMHFVEMSSFPALKLGGDNLVIRDDEGMLIDSLTYTPDWGGDEVALERRSTDIPAYIRDNWGDSPSSQLGTPGAPNEVEMIADPPEVIMVMAVLSDRVRITLNRPVSEETGTNLQNFEVSDGIAITNIRYRVNEIFLDIDQELEPRRSYELVLKDLEDIFGNAMAEQTHEFSYQIYEPAELRDVVINEFLYRPADEEVTRFVELYNRSGHDVDLDGWQVGRGSGSPVTLRGEEAPDGQTLPIPFAPGEHLVITPDAGWVSDEADQILEVSSIPAFSSLGDAVFIRNEDGETVDSLTYSPSWGGNETGFSLERHDPEAASNDPNNWATNPDGHSAGYRNENYRPDETPPEVQFAGTRADSTLRVYFDQHIDLENDETRFQVSGEQLEVVEFDRHNAHTLILEHPDDSLPDDEDAKLEVSALTDVAGNVTEQYALPISRPLQKGDLVINEIMYQPLADRYGDRPDQSEYLEFYNTRPYAVSLEGIYIHDRPDKDDETSDIHPVSTTGKWIPAEGYAVMHGDPANEFEATRLARFFDLEDERFVLRADRTSLSLSTTGDEVYLADSTRQVIDQVSYHPDWHNQNVADVRGRALERKQPTGDSNDARNWTTTTRNEGGTPLEQNTVFAEPGAIPESEGIKLDPDPFAPNADGRDDNLNISWKLSEPDYLMRIRIYDRHGRLVRTLAEGEQAGLEGTVIWDGMKDDGSENRIGFYIVLFEAYNSANGSNRTFRETVVLAREM